MAQCLAFCLELRRNVIRRTFSSCVVRTCVTTEDEMKGGNERNPHLYFYFSMI